jgi:hypothetical protein
MYPVLPEDRIQPQQATGMQPTVVMADQKYPNRDIAGDVEMQPRNSSAKQVMAPSAPAAMSAVPVVSAQQNTETPTVINDLLAENNRLRQQIEEMRTQAQQRTAVDSMATSGPAITGMSSGRIQARLISD